jgi:hypothetical protein
MKKNLVLIAAASMLVLLGAGCSKSVKVPVTTTTAPTAPVELKLKWPVGRRMVQSLDVRQTSEIAAPGMPNPMKQDMNMGQSYAISVLKERDGGGHEVEMEFRNLRITVKSGQQTMLDFDSAKKSSGNTKNPAAAAFE